MILGAGPFQLPAIRKAVARGHYVITVDYLPHNIGHKFSHQYVNCSTTDRECVARAARENDIDGICTFSSDVAIPTVGYVCEQLGLPGVSLVAAETLSMKHRFRSFLRECGLPHPQFVIARSFDEFREQEELIEYPVVFKPVDTSGSRGISCVSTPSEREAVRKAFENALQYSRSGTVCVEEFIRGVEVGGDGVLLDGKFLFITITHKHLDGFLVRGHSLPTNICDDDQKRVREILELCCSEVGYTDGPLNFDVIVSDERVVIIEMSPRNGGNGIPSVIARATGVDIEVATLALALGEEPDMTQHTTEIQGAASWVFGSERGGTLQSIRDLEAVRSDVPEVFDLFVAVPINGEVKPFEHNGNLVGYALFDCTPPERYDEITTRIEQALCMEITANE